MAGNTYRICTQELVGHCLQLFQENQERISHLEDYLQQYGYQPQPKSNMPINPLELLEAAGNWDLAELCIHLDS